MSNLKRVFYGCEAFLCEVLGERRCRVWLQNPKLLLPPYDKTKTIELDLSAIPSNGLAGAQMDDLVVRRNSSDLLGLTTLGPRWPKSFRGASFGHAAEAGVWLEESSWSRAYGGGLMHYPPLTGTQVYRWQTVIYANDAAGNRPLRRYSGFHAKCTDIRGGIYYFQAWSATEDIITAPGKSIQVNFADYDQVDRAMSAPFEVNQEGALFLRWELLATVELVSPKLPIGEHESPPYPSVSAASTRRSLLEAPASGEAGTSSAAHYSMICEQFIDGKPLNVSHADADLVLLQVQSRLANSIAIGRGREGLVQAVQRLSECKNVTQGVTLDLIAHSTSLEQVLVFGSWLLRAGEELKKFCSAVKSSGKIGQIRLLGCGTISTAEGFAAAEMIQNLVGVPVCGTTALVDLTCFDERSYIDGYLRWVDDGRVKIGDFDIDLEKSRFTANLAQKLPFSLYEEPWTWYEDGDLSALGPGSARNAWNALVPMLAHRQGVERPGLLLEPLLVGRLPFDDDAVFRTTLRPDRPSTLEPAFQFDILLNWKLLRVWHPSKARSLLYSIEHEAELISYFNGRASMAPPVRSS